MKIYDSAFPPQIGMFKFISFYFISIANIGKKQQIDRMECENRIEKLHFSMI